jgi:hypothetical protein
LGLAVVGYGALTANKDNMAGDNMAGDNMAGEAKDKK